MILCLLLNHRPAVYPNRRRYGADTFTACSRCGADAERCRQPGWAGRVVAWVKGVWL